MSWQKVKIGSFLKERIGRFKPSEANKMNLKRIEKIDFSGTYQLVDKLTNTDMILVKHGDLLISGINAEKGAITVYDDKEDALATIHYSSYEFDKNKIDVEYFRWYLTSDTFKDLLKASAGSGIKAELKSKHLLPIEIYLPCFASQKEIIEGIKIRHNKIFTIQKSIEEQQIHLRLLRQTILKEAVQGKLSEQDPTDETGGDLIQRIKAEKQKLAETGKLKKEKEAIPITADEIPYELPKGWIWCRLEEIRDINYSLSYGVLVPGPDLGDKGVPFVRIQDLENPKEERKPNKSIALEIDEVFKKTRLNGGEILIGCVGSIGKIAVAPKSWKGANIARAICRLVPDKNVNFDYLLLALQSPTVQKYFTDTTRTLAQPTLNISFIQSTLIPLPPLSEQIKIVTKVQKLMLLLQYLLQQVKQSQEQIGQLLQRMLKEKFSDS